MENIRQFKHANFIVTHSIVPLLLGTLIYLFWRSESLLVFRWLNLIHLSGAISTVRNFLSSLNVSLPNWFLFSLPDGLWLYATTTGIGGIWLDHWKTEAWFWLVIPLALGCTFEIGQYAQAIPGTYSATDIGAYICGSILGILVINAKRHRG